MKNLFIIALFLFVLWINYMQKKFENPSKLIMIFGKKGSGKTTLATKLAVKYQKQGRLVFSNTEIYGTYKLDVKKDIGFRIPPPGSVLIIDEAALIWDSRNFKNFDLGNVGRFFRLQRHYHLGPIYLFSQAFDIDKRLRDLCDEMYLCTNVLGFLSVAKKIRKIPKLHKATQSEDGTRKQEGFITEDYRYFLPTAWIWTYIPRWVKFFNSFEPDPLKPIRREKYQFINDVYLFNLLHWPFYKAEQIRDIRRAVQKWYKLQTMSSVVTWERFVELSS